MDFVTGKVSNKLILPGLLSGLVFALILDGTRGLEEYFMGVMTPIVILILVFAIGGIGAGDVKLFAVIGGFIGAQGVFQCILASLMIGAVISLGKILINKTFFACFNNLINYISKTYYMQKYQIYKREKNNTIHFTLPIFISVLIYMGGRV
jgi:prepilin peptidase CpaA